MAQESAKQPRADARPDSGNTATSGGSDRSVTFGQFVVSLAASAMVHLGEGPDPTTGEVRRDLTLARHEIDLLAVLQDKTAGNLDEEEAKLLDTVLYDLRTRFLAARNR